MSGLVGVVLGIIENLERSRKTKGVVVSRSKKQDSGLSLSQLDKKELGAYLENADHVYFHNIEPAKDSWHQLNSLWKPFLSAAFIELAKYLPYLPGIDKNKIYRAIGIRLGENTTIAPRVQFDYFHPELIEIGDSCLIGDSAKIWTHDYGLNYFMIGSVKIGNNVFIGTESIVWPCEVGDNVEIGARAIVYGRVPEGAKVEGQGRSSYETF